MDFDVIIVLGGGNDNYGQPSNSTIKRLDKCIEFLKEKSAKYIILSGGRHNENRVSEAKAMADYLISKGLSKEIFLEEEAKDTISNAYFTKINFLESRKLFKIAVITSDFHIPRTRYIFKKVLGDSFKISYISADSGLSKEVLARLKDKEKKKLSLLKKLIDGIKDGDDKSIKKIIEDKHPAYTKHPELTDVERKIISEYSSINK